MESLKFKKANREMAADEKRFHFALALSQQLAASGDDRAVLLHAALHVLTSLIDGEPQTALKAMRLMGELLLQHTVDFEYALAIVDKGVLLAAKHGLFADRLHLILLKLDIYCEQESFVQAKLVIKKALKDCEQYVVLSSLSFLDAVSTNSHSNSTFDACTFSFSKETTRLLFRHVTNPFKPRLQTTKLKLCFNSSNCILPYSLIHPLSMIKQTQLTCQSNSTPCVSLYCVG